MKVSYREIKRQNEKFKKEIDGIRKREGANFQALFLVLIKLYKLNPKDDIFHNGQFREDIIEAVKKAAAGPPKKPKEPEMAELEKN